MAEGGSDGKKFIRAKKYPGGRPPKLTPELTDRICAAMRAGAYVETAAAYAGVRNETLYDWLRQAAVKPKSIYGEFARAIEKAFADAEMRDLLVIDKCANGSSTAVLLRDENGNVLKDKDGLERYISPLQPNWNAASWRLERRNRERWGRVERQEHTGKGGGPIATTHVTVTIPDNGRSVGAYQKPTETTKEDESK